LFNLATLLGISGSTISGTAVPGVPLCLTMEVKKDKTELLLALVQLLAEIAVVAEMNYEARKVWYACVSIFSFSLVVFLIYLIFRSIPVNGILTDGVEFNFIRLVGKTLYVAEIPQQLAVPTQKEIVNHDFDRFAQSISPIFDLLQNVVQGLNVLDIPDDMDSILPIPPPPFPRQPKIL
jgi:hypothetical protein